MRGELSTSGEEVVRAEPTLSYPQEPVTYKSLVTFQLGRQVYALPIEPIVQIVEMVAITAIPQVNHSVEGVINYHGVTIPVINLRCHLGLPKAPLGLDTHIIIAKTGGRMVGLIVDQVLQVLELTGRGAQIARADDILPEGLGEASIVRGVVHAPAGTVIVFDLDHLLLPQQARALAQVVDALPTEPVVEVEQETDPGEPATGAETEQETDPDGSAADVETEQETYPSGPAPEAEA
jgi:purine-binding chemotaxis protein CheW